MSDTEGTVPTSPADRFAPRPGHQGGEARAQAPMPPAETFAGETADRTELGIEFRWEDGRMMTVDYMHLVATRLGADGEAVIEFSRFRFKLSGRSLAPLLRRVKDHRQALVEEVDPERDYPELSDAAVYGIVLEEE